jgi:hypothetical protein
MMKCLRFSFRREANLIAIMHYAFPAVSLLLFFALWLFGLMPNE